MAKVTEITVWTRGVVMDKEARDVANAFAQAAKMEGKFVQAFDNYEDLPDREAQNQRLRAMEARIRRNP